MEDSRENDKTNIYKKSPIIDLSMFTFSFDSDATLLGYPRYAENTGRLRRHNRKVKNSSLPTVYQ